MGNIGGHVNAIRALVEVVADMNAPPVGSLSDSERRVFCFVAQGGYACFRLPALLRLPTPDGRSLALYAEGRLKSCSDYAPMDLVYAHAAPLPS